MTLEQLEQLIEGCQAGKRASQQQFYRQFYALAIAVCRRYADHREEAEEMCHDGFLRAFDAIGKLEKPAAVKGWLRPIFVRAAIDHYRKYRKNQPIHDPLETAFDQPSSPEPAALSNLNWEEKLRLITALPPACRHAFNLCVIEEYPSHEAAEMLGIAEGTLRGNLAKARMRLRQMLEQTEKMASKKPENF